MHGLRKRKSTFYRDFYKHFGGNLEAIVIELHKNFKIIPG